MSNNLNFKEIGNGDTILLIHGLGSSSQCWEYQINNLSYRYKVLTVDLYGHGENDFVPQYLNIKSTAKEIIALLNEKGYKNVSIIGHSLGGLIAIEMAVQNTILFNKLILIDTPTKQMGIANLSIIQYLNLKMIESDFQTVIKEHYKKMTQRDELRDKLMNQALKTNKTAYHKYFSNILKTDYSQAIQKIDVDTYVILTKSLISSESRLSITNYKYGYSCINEKNIFYYDDCHHFIMLEQPKRFTDRIMKILSQ